MLTKKQALALFREDYLPAIRKLYEQDGRVDTDARRQEWSNFTDALAKEGQITRWQDEHWTNPF